jgi:hypothetical protein
MSKIKYSALVSDVRNKLNGSVLSKNRFGNYIRNKTTPVNPQTVYQQNARAILAAMSQGWAGITEDQRNGWKALAQTMPFTDIFGDPKILTGQMMFVKLNTNLEKIGEAPLSDAPAKEAIPFLETVSVAATVAAGVITDANFSVIVFATPAVNPGISFVKNQFRMIGVAPAPAAGVIDISALWNARFGSAVAGQRIFVRMALVSENSGQQGIPSQAIGVVGV